jgi:hypothetical protein
MQPTETESLHYPLEFFAMTQVLTTLKANDVQQSMVTVHMHMSTGVTWAMIDRFEC